MASFKTTDKISKGANVSLVGDELHHAKKVRRLTLGERLEVSDGVTIGEGTLTDINDDQAVVTIDLVTQKRTSNLTLAVAITKKPAMEEIAQHATELGVREIIFFSSTNSPITLPEIPERLLRIADEASKQANRPTAPPISIQASLDEVLRSTDHTSILYGKEDSDHTAINLSGGALLVIGPEGGLTEAEDTLLSDAGAIGVSLSPFTLRTPTAALSLAAYANTLLAHS